MSEAIVVFLKEWQALIGSFLGPFLAVVLSAFGFGLKRLYDRREARKGFRKYLNLYMTQSLNDIVEIRKQLRDFITVVREYAKEARQGDQKKYFLMDIYLPPIRRIYHDPHLRQIHSKSFYLNNRFLGVAASFAQHNNVLPDLRNFLPSIKEQAITSISLSGGRYDPPTQRASYANSLDQYASALEQRDRELGEAFYLSARVLKYNQKKLCSNSGLYQRLKEEEGASFRCFRSKKDMNDFTGSKNTLDRIDKILQPDIEELLRTSGLTPDPPNQEKSNDS